MKTILTGIRSNNELTLGNYLGALLPMIDMAKSKAGEYQINMFVPDLHSFTTPIDHTKLYGQSLNNVRVFAAAGLPLDNDDINIYRQSYIPAHSELTWILDCFTRFGEMRRMTQFKDKSEANQILIELGKDADKFNEKLSQTQAYLENKEKVTSIDLEQAYLTDMGAAQLLIRKALTYAKLSEELEASVGLFNYPVLMAADMLLYNAEYVPVGDDQTQHLEFTRDIGERMNARFGKLFDVPMPVAKQHEFFGKDQGLRIRDLMDPTKKMSKSDESGKGVIFLTDTPEVATKKIMSAATDSFADIDFDMQKRPGISNLLQILALLSNQDLQEVIAKYKGQTQYGELKKDVAKVVADFLSDFQGKLKTIDDTKIVAKLESSEAKMNKVAGATLLKVQQAVGLRPKN